MFKQYRRITISNRSYAVTGGYFAQYERTTYGRFVAALKRILSNIAEPFTHAQRKEDQARISVLENQLFGFEHEDCCGD